MSSYSDSISSYQYLAWWNNAVIGGESPYSIWTESPWSGVYTEGHFSSTVNKIPGGSVIDGIEVTLHGYTQYSNYVTGRAYLFVGGSQKGSYRESNNYMSAGSPSDITIGGPSDTWDTTWSPNDFDSFGMAIYGVNNNVSLEYTTVAIDYVTITIYYHAGAQNYTKTLTGSLVTNGGLKKSLSKKTTGVFSSSGVFGRNNFRSLSGVFTASGEVTCYKGQHYTLSLSGAFSSGGGLVNTPILGLKGLDAITVAAKDYVNMKVSAALDALLTEFPGPNSYIWYFDPLLRLVIQKVMESQELTPMSQSLVMANGDILFYSVERSQPLLDTNFDWRVTLDTFVDGIEPGQEGQIIIPEAAINGVHLIQQVTLTIVSVQGYTWKFRIIAVPGNLPSADWLSYYRGLQA